MRRSSALPILVFTLVALISLVSVTHVQAITYGFIDENNAFPNVGAFVVRSPTGRVFPICSGTLIAPDVFLTASHCTLFYTNELAPDGFSAFVSFDNPIPFDDFTNPLTELIPVTEVVTNPLFNHRQNDPGDIAVLILDENDTSGITPAALPPADLLDQLAARNGLRNALFTPVGYGAQNRVVGGGIPFFQNINPIPRMFAFSSFNALNKGYLRLSQNPSTGNGGTCFGDSGGPNFLTVSGTRLLVGITITGDAVCRSTNVSLRTDTTSARAFLSEYVSLP